MVVIQIRFLLDLGRDLRPQKTAQVLLPLEESVNLSEGAGVLRAEDPLVVPLVVPRDRPSFRHY